MKMSPFEISRTAGSNLEESMRLLLQRKTSQNVECLPRECTNFQKLCNL